MIEHQKKFCFTWKQSLKRRKRHILDIKIETKINDEKRKLIKSNEAIRILRVYIALNMDLIKQYQIIKDKMRNAVAKLKNTNIYPLLTYVFYNTYFTKLVYFRCEIVSINEK